MANFFDNLDVLTGAWTNLDRIRPPRARKTYKKRYDPFAALTEGDFRSKYRFTKVNMRRLIDLVRPYLDVNKPFQRHPNFCCAYVFSTPHPNSFLHCPFLCYFVVVIETRNKNKPTRRIIFWHMNKREVGNTPRNAKFFRFEAECCYRKKIITQIQRSSYIGKIYDYE